MKRGNPAGGGCRFTGDMSATTVGLLRAASEVLGGPRALAAHFGISEALLSKYMTDSLPLPDPLLLQAVDVILANRIGGLPDDSKKPQNHGHGSGRAEGTGRA